MNTVSYTTCYAACALTTTSTSTTSTSTSTSTTSTSTTTLSPMSINVQLDEYDGGNPPYLDMDMVVAGSTYYYDGGAYTQNVPANLASAITLKTKDGNASHTWGSFTTASARLKVFENGILVVDQTNYYRKNEGPVDFTSNVTFTVGNTYIVSGSNWTFVGAQPTTTTTTAAPTTTSTSTSTTTTTGGVTNFLISTGFSAPDYCDGLGGSTNSVYAAQSDWLDVTIFYTDSGMTTAFAGNDLYYGDQYSSYGTTLQIDNNGNVIGNHAC